MRPTQWLDVVVTVALLCRPSIAQPLNALQGDSRPEAYIASHGGTLAPAGKLEIDGRRMACGPYPTVLDPDYKDFGAAPRGFLILNDRLFAALPTPVKLWIFSHECAHQTVGADEVKADCVAVQRGKREGWLTPAGLDQICEFMLPARQDEQHVSGVHRCKLMRQCLHEAKKEPRR